MENTKTKFVLVGIALALMLASLVSVVSAAASYPYVSMCLGNDQSININSATYTSTSPDGRMICGAGKCTAHLKSGSGYVILCVQKISDVLYTTPTVPSRCSGGCNWIGGTTGSVNMTLTVTLPFANGGVYNKQSFNLDITTNKIASITLTNNVAVTEKNLCPNCKAYKRAEYVKEGFNDITIRAVNGFEIVEKHITFIIDSKKPVISKVLPLANSFASGDFSIVYTEMNLKNVTLYYGILNQTIKNVVKKDCPSGVKQQCDLTVDLSQFEGKEIVYWFNIVDIANTNISSKPVKIKVDNTSPKINSLSNSVLGKYVTINMSITELNFKNVQFYDNYDLNPKWKILCSSLKNGYCVKKLFLKNGEHPIDLQVNDKAGNAVGQSVTAMIVA
ncbi:MAG: hypothetical protein WCP89_03040 [archaeon]